MTSMWLFIACQVSVIACGVVSGVFLTFSDFVMKSLNSAQSDAGVEVMQAINRDVMKTVFMALLLGMTALSPILAGYTALVAPGPETMWITAATILYIAGVFLVTIIFNVPMNNRLAGMDYANFEAAAYWDETYLPRWTFWNWVRAIASAAAAMCFLAACITIAG